MNNYDDFEEQISKEREQIELEKIQLERERLALEREKIRQKQAPTDKKRKTTAAEWFLVVITAIQALGALLLLWTIR